MHIKNGETNKGIVGPELLLQLAQKHAYYNHFPATCITYLNIRLMSREMCGGLKEKNHIYDKHLWR